MAAIVQQSHLAHFPAAVRNILVIVSGLQDPRATAANLAAMHARDAIRIHLLAIETPPSGYARSFLGAVDFRKLKHDDGLKALAPLRAALDAAGIPYRFHIEIGRWLDTISHYAREIGCARIVVGDNPHGAWRNLVLWHDCRRIKAFLRQSGRDCVVVQRGEGMRAAAPGFSREVSHPN
jgi:nucleotide-binding universal stress UspA family protein